MDEYQMKDRVNICTAVNEVEMEMEQREERGWGEEGERSYDMAIFMYSTMNVSMISVSFTSLFPVTQSMLLSLTSA